MVYFRVLDLRVDLHNVLYSNRPSTQLHQHRNTALLLRTRAAACARNTVFSFADEGFECSCKNNTLNSQPQLCIVVACTSLPLRRQLLLCEEPSSCNVLQGQIHVH